MKTLLSGVVLLCLSGVAHADGAGAGADAGAVAAQDAAEIDFCAVDPADYQTVIAPLLVGNWTTQMGVGQLTMQGRTIALPRGVQSNETIALIGDELVSTANGQGPFEMVFETEQDWVLELDEDSPLSASDIVSSEELGLAAGCDANDLVRLKSTGIIQTSEGPVEFFAHFYVVSENLMYGTTRGVLSGGVGVAKRVFTSTK